MRITQSIAKGIYRIIGDIEVVRTEFLEPVAFPQWTARIHMVVIQRNLSYILRPGGAQLAGGIDIPEQHVGNGMSRFGTAKPYVEDSRHLLAFPFDRQRAAGEQDEDDGFTGLQE